MKLTTDETTEIAELMKTNPRAGRMLLAERAAATVRPDDPDWQYAFAHYVEANRVLYEASKDHSHD